nr:MAG TPA: Z1 domain protein [Caudoviricetes sp.]
MGFTLWQVIRMFGFRWTYKHSFFFWVNHGF